MHVPLIARHVQRSHLDVNAGLVDINKAETDGGMTPLYHACLFGKIAIAKFLLEAGADFEKTTLRGSSPLFIASQQGYGELVTALLDFGADVGPSLN